MPSLEIVYDTYVDLYERIKQDSIEEWGIQQKPSQQKIINYKLAIQ